MSPLKKRPRILQSLSSHLSSFLKKTPSPTLTIVKDQPFPTPETFQSIPRQSQEHRDEHQEEIEPIWYQSNEGGDEHANDVTIDATINATNKAQPHVNSESSSGTMENQGSAWEPGTFSPLPTIDEVALALQDIKKILKPPQKTGPGYKDPELDLMFQRQLEDMRQFMWTYINPDLGTWGQWQAASLSTANNLEKGLGHAWKLRQWVQAYVTGHKVLPINPYGY